MKLIIAGSRDLTEFALVEAAVVRFHLEPSEVISGCARGPDQAGAAWASDNDVYVHSMPANWKAHGKAAGYIRNAEMAKVGDELLAIWDGKSKGTQNMIEQMVKLQKPVHIMRVSFQEILP